MRPADTGDWDYANESHARWVNPFDEAYESTDSFFELYDLAACEASRHDPRLPRRAAGRRIHGGYHTGPGIREPICPGVYEVRL